MKSSFIFHSVAQLVRVKAAKTGRTFKVQSKINPEIQSFPVILSCKQFDKAGY